MAYEPTVWKNREVEHPRRFTLQNNGDGTTTLNPAEGQVTEPGTPIMAVTMNNIEQGIADVERKIPALNNTITSASTTAAATASAVKQVNDLKANRAQQSSLIPTGNANWILGNSRYFKDEFGIVHFYLNAQIGQKTDSTFITPGLPVGYRPLSGLIQPFSTYNSGSPVPKVQLISIDTGGNMILVGAIQGDSNIAVGYFSFRTT